MIYEKIYEISLNKKDRNLLVANLCFKPSSVYAKWHIIKFIYSTQKRSPECYHLDITKKEIKENEKNQISKSDISCSCFNDGVGGM